MNSILGRGRIKAFIFLRFSVFEKIPSRQSVFCLESKLEPKAILLFEILIESGEKLLTCGLVDNGLANVGLVCGDTGNAIIWTDYRFVCSRILKSYFAMSYGKKVLHERNLFSNEFSKSATCLIVSFIVTMGSLGTKLTIWLS